MKKHLTLPLSENQISSLVAGEQIYLTGSIYTARDAAHKKMIEALERGEELPIDIKGACIYYVGPCPEKPGQVIGSCGPTTSARMDKYTPTLLDLGLKIIIGKGERDDSVENSLRENNAVYLAAIGGTGALIKKCVKSSKLIAYPELLSEAIRELYVEDFPLIVTIDSNGNNLYKSEKVKYENKLQTDVK